MEVAIERSHHPLPFWHLNGLENECNHKSFLQSRGRDALRPWTVDQSGLEVEFGFNTIDERLRGQKARDARFDDIV